MDVVCALKDGEVREHQVLNRREAMFRVAQEKEETGIYIFVPIHTEGKTLGFAMLTRDADIAEVSAEYIQQQILQQASATLLATANQSPSIALQLI